MNSYYFHDTLLKYQFVRGMVTKKINSINRTIISKVKSYKLYKISFKKGFVINQSKFFFLIMHQDMLLKVMITT